MCRRLSSLKSIFILQLSRINCFPDFTVCLRRNLWIMSAHKKIFSYFILYFIFKSVFRIDYIIIIADQVVIYSFNLNFYMFVKPGSWIEKAISNRQIHFWILDLFYRIITKIHLIFPQPHEPQMAPQKELGSTFPNLLVMVRAK